MIPDSLTVHEKTYHCLRLLGKGKGGYSYLVTDGTANFVLKQIHHEPCDYYQFGNKIESELHDYQHLKSLGIRIPEMLDTDIAQERILKEYIDSPTIADLVMAEQMQPSYLEQIKAMCSKLYAANTNIDYFPTNFIVENGVLYYIDYECNEYTDTWNFENWGMQYWSKTDAFKNHFRMEITDKQE